MIIVQGFSVTGNHVNVRNTLFNIVITMKSSETVH